MSDRERVLELARAAWRVSQPTEPEVDRAVQRVERRLRRSERPRARAGRRPVMILAFATVFAGALAYAASGGVRWFGPETPAGGEPPSEVAPSKAKTTLGVPLERAPESPAPAPTAEEPKDAPPAATPAPAGSARPSPAPSSAAAAASTWRAVDRALAAEDEEAAQRALGSLAGSRDPTTRAKAELGLAQLAQSRGDCAAAKKHALAARVPGADKAVVRRALAIAEACAK